MTNPEIPGMDLQFPQVAVCPIHGEPFRKDWPKGFAQLVILTLELIQSDGTLAEEAGGDPAKIGQALTARPACERVPVGRLRQLYLDAGIGVDGVCVVCRRRRLGTEIQRTVPGRRLGGLMLRSRVEVMPHVCFDCVLRAKPDPRRPDRADV